MIKTLPPQPSAPDPAARLDRNSPERSTPGAPSNTPSTEQSQRTVHHFVRHDQICVLTFDRAGSAANIFDRRTLTELGEELDFIAGDPQIQGVVITSAKRSIFIAGADLHMMSENASPQDVRELIDLGQTMMNRLAALPIPTVAAIHGACVGGGYELCLACDYRVASTDRATKIGLPETMLGLLPAWGGSTRLPRLIGLPAALDIILAGKTLAAKQALKRGMVDELAPVEYLVEVAARTVSRGKPRRSGHLLVNNRLAASAIAARARSQVLKKTRGHYPAVSKALEVVTHGISKTIPESLALERDGIVELVQTEACHNLIRVFFLQERAKKLTLPGAGATPSPAPIAHTAVIGSGVMGAGIAQWLSARQLPVILRDLNTEQVAKGMASIAKIYQDGAKRHVFTPREVRDGLDRISPASGPVPLGHCDLVIEAAVESLELKKKIFQGLDELAGDRTILATNTSALPISELAASTRHPERVVGLHFFNPVHRMQLVEIVAARQTSQEVLQRALQFVRNIGKLPVIVKDSPGFLVNRILMPYLVEAGNLFEAGADITNLDEAMLDFGMPMGPMCLLDEVGIDVALHVAKTLAAHYSDRMTIPETLNKMIQAGMLGRKSGRGFYLHRKGKSPQPNPQAASFFASNSASALSRQDLQERMVLLMINETARCLEEQVVTEPEDVDFAMIMGTGFAPFRGGPLRYADSVGIASLVAKMDRLAASGSPYFAPCALLRSMAANGKGFYGATTASPRIINAPAAEQAKSNGHLAAPATVTVTKPLITAPQKEAPVEEPRSLIDTSKMSTGQRAALELTEAARETTQKASFVSGLFMGAFDLPQTFPLQSAEDRERGDVFLKKLERLLHDKVDPDEIDRTGEIPAPVIEELAKLGAFGIKIATEYGGLGLSQTNYCRAAMLLGSYCGNLTALLSAHQSIGVPQPLILFGTEEQKRKYLPRVARGEISAFALTESGAGSDPATMLTHAEPAPDGKSFILNGEKLWCTNGTKAGVIVVMAKTPSKMVGGRSKDQITAFIVETDWPGVEVTHRCHFMGLRSLYNGVMRFTNVRVPRENILLAEGKGLRVALTTLNTGRLTLPAACVGLAQRCLDITRRWAAERTQWGAPIGKHAAIADKIARMAANTFAMESMTMLAASAVDQDKHADVRLEAAMCKMWGSEQSWEIVNDAVQIRGGRGYETAASLKARGEQPIPLERFLRDSRINTIFEGSSEIMRLFIAREALDPHLKVSAAALNSKFPLSQRARAAGKAALFYARWYPKQWVPTEWFKVRGSDTSRLSRHFRYAARASRRLARAMFHAMLRHGPKLERQQLLLGRFVDIGTEIFAITATCLRAERLMQGEATGVNKADLLHLVDYFCRASRLRIEEKFRGVRRNADQASYRLAQQVLKGNSSGARETGLSHD
ncbi:MAG TPA: 3-hydroxyacyl-CoA dehydrogenase NAD-binding domain-containing protein [Verrucomicrobiae bacterium]|jgi:3-hydroxyacyl-CoA dehydrogenase/alkylation response protein AidB-like acyl-CoA dehydrogenase/enoyl-CoA hydratase/carnithine racemase|nr:3-hydroxyacyl-CoA dehydrogenase NAD-binding domain-containing protein [Verrucomicrobiae bacterium]